MPGAVCLGVTNSLAGKTWRFRLEDDSRALGIAQRFGLSDLVARVLAARGFEAEDADRHFDASLRAWMPDPSTLADLDIAAERIADAIAAHERCAVFGDYDVDGGSSAALMLRYFRVLGRELTLYVPDRMREGYGPNAAALRSLAGQGVTLVVTVDCGAQAFDAFEAAAEAKLQVIVADHHLMGERSPRALAMVNPNRPDDVSGLGHLSAAGVTFMLLAGVNRVLRRRGWFEANGIAEPDLRQSLDLVALATICDVVPLTGLNRAFVKQGLKIIDRGANAGLKALANVAKLTPPLKASHFGFSLGPRVNAGGRVGRADLGALLLATDDPVFAADAAAELDHYNRERQAIEAHVQKEAFSQLDRRAPGEGLVAAFGENWHAGVIGIVAGRLKDRHDLPSAVFALEAGVAKASLRSVFGVDIGQAVAEAKEAGLLLTGGGHRMAAGLSCERDKVEEVIAFLDRRLAPAVAARPERGVYAVDGILGPLAMTPSLFDAVERAGPYGAGNPEPSFAIPDARIVQASMAGENHVSVIGMCGSDRFKAIAFRSAERPLGKVLMQKGRPVHLAGRLLNNEWQGTRRVELSIEDAAAVGPG